MNIVYALMIITSNGVIEAPNNFSSMKDCEKIANRLQNVTAYCVEKKPVDVEKEMGKFIALFKSLQKEMMNEK